MEGLWAEGAGTVEVMRQFRIGQRILDDNDAGFEHALDEAYRLKVRPLCLCQETGIPMYIAKIGDQHVVKRMPMSGPSHHPKCPSYELPGKLSGLDPLLGTAIQLDPASGLAALKVGFSLSKLGNRASPTPGAGSSGGAATETNRLSLRGLLHYLWNEAELTHWTAWWNNKRHWWHVQQHLKETAAHVIVKGGPLGDLLFVPEPFRASDKAAIEYRRALAMAPAQPPRTGRKRLMIVVGEVKEISPGHTAHKLIIKHMPGFVFLLDDGLHKRLEARFGNELALWDANDDSHLIAIATFGLTPAGLAIVDEMALMVVARNWVPYESLYEKILVDALARVKELSVKALRYNLPQDVPIASAMFQQRDRPAALYIVPLGQDSAYEEKLGELLTSLPGMDAWIWRPADGEMPPLPAR